MFFWAVLEGQDFRERVLRPDGSVDPEAFRQLWGPLRVLARCSPLDKLTIVRGGACHKAQAVAPRNAGLS